MRRGIIATALILAGAGLWSCSPVEASDFEPEELLRSATVTVAERCAGVIVEGSQHVVTAAHCLFDGEELVPLELFDGTPTAAQVLVVDRESDVAILGLEAPASALGLPFADALAEPGTPLMFVGRVDWDSPLQDVTVVRHGPCPSLPGVPAALFTSLRGRKGDSGAPIVDDQMRVVGLVHGGAACSIAAPTHEVPRMLEDLTPSS